MNKKIFLISAFLFCGAALFAGNVKMHSQSYIGKAINAKLTQKCAQSESFKKDMEAVEDLAVKLPTNVKSRYNSLIKGRKYKEIAAMITSRQIYSSADKCYILHVLNANGASYKGSIHVIQAVLRTSKKGSYIYELAWYYAISIICPRWLEEEEASVV